MKLTSSAGNPLAGMIKELKFAKVDSYSIDAHIVCMVMQPLSMEGGRALA